MPGMTVSELQVKVSADTSAAESGLASLGGKLGSVGGTLATAFGGAAIAGIAALAGGIAASTVAAAGFEAQMSAVSAVSGATASEMASLSALALELGANTSFSASEAAQGIEELVKAGVSIGDVMGGAASASLSLAAAGAIDVGSAAEIAANAMNQFNLTGGELGHVADLIAGAANASAIDVGDFQQSLSAVGAVANLVGFNFDDTATAIALMGQAGIKGSDAGTSLKTMLLGLQPSTKEQTGLFRELGLITADGANQFFDATGKVKSMADVAGILKTALAGMSSEQETATLKTLFGTDAIRAAAIVAHAGSEGFNEMAGSMSKVTAEAVAAERLNNLKGDIEQLGGALETAGIKIGTALLPGLRGIVQGATEIVNDAAPLLESFATTVVTGMGEAGAALTTLAGKAATLLGIEVADYTSNWEALGDGIKMKADEAAIAVGKLADTLGQIGAKAAELGTMESLNRALASMKTNSAGISTNIEGLATALGRLSESAGGAEGKINLVAAALRAIAAGVENAVAVTSIIVDSVVQMGRVFVDFQTILLETGKALVAWATGNKEAQLDASRVAGEAFQDMWNSSVEWKDRTAEAASGVVSAVEGVGQAMGVVESETAAGMAAAATAAETGSAGIAAGVETGMTSAAASAETGMATVAGAVETGAASAQVAAETGMAGVAVAAETNMAAATAAVQAEAPAMAAAAEQGASGAVSAVQGQTGAASGAGQSLGEALGSGMEGGIGAYVGRVAAAAGRLVSAAIGAARSEAQAESPSKKTEKLGEDLAEGLEIGLSKSDLGAEMQAKIRDFIAATREYIPVAGEIKRVEDEIKRIRDDGQTAALFRAEQMIDLESESLRLKESITRLDRDSIGLRQDLAATTREITDAERGSLADRTETIEIDAKRKAIRLETLKLEEQLLTVHKNSDRTEFIERQIDALRTQDRLLGIEAERITTTNSLATTAARVRREGLDDQVRGYDTVIQTIENQIEVLGAEAGVFQANEAIIANATQNEIDYRNRLIAVFTAEGKPLADRITAGRALVDQLHNEGRISDELHTALTKQLDKTLAATSATSGLGSAAGAAVPQMDAAARKAAEMAAGAQRIADGANRAANQVSHLASGLGRLPSWFTPGGGGGGGLFRFAEGGRPPVGIPSIVGERGPELFVPDRAGTVIPADVTRSWMGGSGGSSAPMQTHRVVLAWPDGRQAGEIVIRGYDDAKRRGWTPGGLTG